MILLRPCAHCAGPPEHSVEITPSLLSRATELISCRNCAASMRTSVLHPQPIAEQWNRRANDLLIRSLMEVASDATRMLERAGVDVTYERELLKQAAAELGEEL